MRVGCFQVVVKAVYFSAREDKCAEVTLVTVELYDRFYFVVLVRRHRDFVKMTSPNVVFDSEEETAGFEDYLRWFGLSAPWAYNTF